MKLRRPKIYAFAATLLAAATLFVSLQGSVLAAPPTPPAIGATGRSEAPQGPALPVPPLTPPTMLAPAVVPAPAAAAAPVVTVPQTFNYQGVLRNAQGGLLTNPTQALTVRIWDAALNGTARHTEVFPSVAVRDGLFNVVIGDDPANPLKDGDLNVSPRYIGVTLAAGTELIPRQRIHPVPMSFLAETANNATTATTLVPGASVQGLNLVGPTKMDDVAISKLAPGGLTAFDSAGGTGFIFGTPGGWRFQVNSTDTIMYQNAYVGGNATINGNAQINGSINGEKQPMVLDIGTAPDTTDYWERQPVDIGPLCGDADGCTMKLLFRIKSTDEVRVITEQIYIEQPNVSGNKNPGLHGYARQLGGGGDGSFVLGTAAKFDLIAAPWSWIWVRNYQSIVNGVLTAGPVYTGYNVAFMTAPNIAAKVIIYDR